MGGAYPLSDENSAIVAQADAEVGHWMCLRKSTAQSFTSTRRMLSRTILQNRQDAQELLGVSTEVAGFGG